MGGCEMMAVRWEHGGELARPNPLARQGRTLGIDTDQQHIFQGEPDRKIATLGPVPSVSVELRTVSVFALTSRPTTSLDRTPPTSTSVWDPMPSRAGVEHTVRGTGEIMDGRRTVSRF